MLIFESVMNQQLGGCPRIGSYCKKYSWSFFCAFTRLSGLILPYNNNLRDLGMSSSHIVTKRIWFIIIFGALFATPAVLMFTLSILPNLYDASRMQMWKPAQATITYTDLEYSYGETTTYKAVAKYHYLVNNIPYKGSRVSIHSGSDNINDYHKNMINHLMQLRNSQQQVTIYYDPDNPSESVIDRSIRWELIGFKSIFIFIFGTFGFGMIYFGWRGQKTNIAPETTDKPWLSRPEWMHNLILSDSKSDILTSGFFTLLWNSISWPLVLLLPKAYEEEGTWIALILVLFPLVGIYLFSRFLKHFFQWKNFGRTPLTLNPFPGAIGGQVCGSIEIGKNLPGGEAYKVVLSCVKQYYSQSINNRHLSEKLIWKKDSLAKLLSRGNHSVLEFCFDVPDDLPESDLNKNETWNLWRLNLSSPDGKLDRNFEIPVFTTGETSSIKVKIPKWQHEHENERLLKTYLPVQNAKHQNLAGNQNEPVIIHYPSFYKPLNKLFFLLVGSFFVGLSIGLWNEMPTIIRGIFIGIGGMMTLAAIYYLLNSLTIIIDKQAVTSIHRFLGLFPRRYKAPFGSIQTITSKEVMRSESSGKYTVYYKVMASLHNGKKILLAQQIEGEKAANLIVDYFQKAMKPGST